MTPGTRVSRSVFVLFAVAVFLAAGPASGQTPAPDASTAGPPRMHETAAQQPQFGTTDLTYYRQAYTEFFPADSSGTYSDVSAPYRGRCSFNGWPLWGPQPHLPGGAKLTYLELDFCDTSSTLEVSLDLYDCSFVGTGCTVIKTLGSGVADTPGCSWVPADISSLNYTIDNLTRELIPVATKTGDLGSALTGVIYGYKLQVSPGPDTATFSDVPVGHPFFQFVEALAAAGITVGYADGRFGVDDSITRGQMAVFMAKALGLHWVQ